MTALINELDAQPGDGEVLLVLDDYHLIDGQPVHGSLAFLLAHLPPGLRLMKCSPASYADLAVMPTIRCECAAGLADSADRSA